MHGLVAVLSQERNTESNEEKPKEIGEKKKVLDEVAEQSERCCGKNDICSHEVLQDGKPDSNSSVTPRKVMRKVATICALFIS